MRRDLTHQEAVLFETVTELNMGGIQPMYSQINKRIEGLIRQTEANKRRLATLVREGFLCLNGKRYYNPLIKEPEPDEDGSRRATIDELQFHANEHGLINFILNLRVHHLSAIPAIAKDFADSGLTKPAIRRLEVLISLLRMMAEEPKSIPELPMEGTNKMGTDFTRDIEALVWVSE